jgi:kynurenine formamidase
LKQPVSPEPGPAFPLRYGASDEVGAANEIHAEQVLRAASLVRNGARYSLAQIVGADSAIQSWRYWKPTLHLANTLPGAHAGSNHLSAVEDTVAGSLHSGTHLDGLGHVGIGEHAYNGNRYADIVGGEGLRRLGIDGVPPFMTRGVMLNLEALHGMPLGQHVITSDELEAAATRQQLEVLPGDALVLHTGWSRLWETDPTRYVAAEPGIGMDAARWCTDRRVCLIGADNWAVEAVPSGDEAFPVHQHCITLFGCYLLENVRTEELVRDGIDEFCFVLLPLRARGASASPVNPLAVT